MSDTSWDVPVDVTALDIDDPGVAEEVARRLAKKNPQVAEGNVPADDPLRLKPPPTAYRTRFYTGAFLVMALLLAVEGFFGGAPWWWWGSIVLMLVITIAVAVRCRVFSSTPSRRQIAAEVARQVRLSQMALRNVCWYRAVAIPGESLFPKTNPMQSDSILSRLATNGLCVVGDDFCSGSFDPKKKADSDRFPAEWGNFSLYNPGGGGDIQTALRGWYLMVALPRVVPHIVLDAKSDNWFGSDRVIDLDPGQRVPMDASFDSRFTVYAPRRYGDDARDLVSSTVRQELLDVGVDVNVELVDNAVIFFKSGPMEWNDSASWYLMDQLRALVQVTMYSRVGEYVDTHLGTPGKKKGQDYQLLSTKPSVAKISNQGTVLKTSHVTWKVAVPAILCGAAILVVFFFVMEMLKALSIPLLPPLVVIGIAWILDMIVIAIIHPRLRHRPAPNRTLR